MKIAIHHREGSFSEHWIDYCKRKGIPYKVVNAYDDNIIAQLADCDALMWHHHHQSEADRIIAKQILFALQQSGKIVFPDFFSGWHFDDKVGEKYLLEANNAPAVPSHAFYNKTDALTWCKNADYPIVFKLRGGAGSCNVKLVRSFSDAKSLINRAFGKGFPLRSLTQTISYSWDKYRRKQISFRNFINISIEELKWHLNPGKVNNREAGYIYFQEFMPNNDFDQRIVVIGGKYAVGEKRYTREGDFRASGSGKFDYNGIDYKAVRVAFDTAKALRLQSVAFDLVYAPDGSVKIVELCYGFGTHGILNAPGYWSDDMQWHGGNGFDFCGWMVEEVLAKKIINEETTCMGRLCL